MKRKLVASAGVLLGLAAQISVAQEPAANFKQFSLDLSVPESPAFAILGVSPQDVIHPTSTRELAGSLVNGISSGGNLQQGIALDTAPFLLVAGRDLTIRDYRGSWLTRVLARTQLSLATAKADNEQNDKGTKVGAGMHVTLYDLGDPRLKSEYFDLPGCYEAAAKALPRQPVKPGEDMEKAAEERQKQLAPAFAGCRKEGREKLWNRSSWVVGIAGAWTNEGSASDGLKSGGAAGWTTFAYGFENIKPLDRYGQLLLHLRVHDDEVVANKDAASGFVKRDSAVLGSRFRLGSDAGAFILETTYTAGRLDNGQSEDVRRVAVGAEFKVSKDIWVVGSIGGEGGFADGTRRSFVLGGLKFGSASEPQFGAK